MLLPGRNSYGHGHKRVKAECPILSCFEQETKFIFIEIGKITANEFCNFLLENEQNLRIITNNLHSQEK